MADMTVPATMRAWRVCHPGPVRGGPLQFDEHAAVPEPAPGELLVAVRACGVCRTDLHIAEGDLAVHRSGVTPGHEVVGEVVVAAGGFEVGDRVGIAWLRYTAVDVSTAGVAPRAYARTPATPAGTPTAATPNSPLSRLDSLTACPPVTPIPNWRRCSAPASSATAP